MKGCHKGGHDMDSLFGKKYGVFPNFIGGHLHMTSALREEGVSQSLTTVWVYILHGSTYGAVPNADKGEGSEIPKIL